MAMNLGVARDGEPVSDINTTPLIDVMLVLLIMLIVTLPPQRHAVKLDTPLPCGPTCAEPDQRPAPILVAVDFRGAVSWNGLPVSRADLQRRLAMEARQSDQAELRVAPDRDARYGAVAHVLASAQRAVLKRMAIVGGA